MSYKFIGQVDLETEECCAQGCGVFFAMPADLMRRRKNDHKSFYCPNGHSMSYTGPSDAQKLKDAQARETALCDQLEAAIHAGEQTRRELLRDRHRFANGVCPCCKRSFGNVRDHMVGEHPEYDVSKVKPTTKFGCSCGREFDTLHGLHIHQGRQRHQSGAYRWDSTKTSERMAHLSVVGR